MDELGSEILTRDYGTPKETFWRRAVCVVTIKRMIADIWKALKNMKNMGYTENGCTNLHDGVGVDGLYSGIIIRTWSFSIPEILVNFWNKIIWSKNCGLGHISLKITKFSTFKKSWISYRLGSKKSQWTYRTLFLFVLLCLDQWLWRYESRCWLMLEFGFLVTIDANK